MAWRLRVVAMVAAVVVGVVSSAAAQPAAPAPADSWPCAPGCRLVESDEIRVTGMDGDVGQGRLRSFDATSIQLTGPDGREVVIGRDYVRQIERRGDSVLNGTLIGAAFGLGTIAAADPMGADVGAVDYIASTALWAGLGALFDHLHKGWTRVYEKPSAPAASGKFPATFWVAPSANGLRVGFTRAF
jgi:hypothetical protein